MTINPEKPLPESTALRSLAAHYYTDPQRYQHELQGFLAHTWQYAAHESMLKNPGDFATFRIADENLFCIRTQNNDIKAFYNVCQHRAHELLTGSGNTALIVCPYHAWSYELSGQLRNGPNLDAVAGFNKSDICLSEVRLKEYVPHIHELAPLEWVEIAERCNWKVSVENYSECYHCQLNHPTFSKGVVKPATYDIQPQGHCLRHTTECQNLDKMSYPIDLDSNPHAGHYSSWFLWPTFSFQVYPGNRLNTYHWRPVDHQNVVLWRGWFSHRGQEDSVVRQLAVQDRETTVEEDIHLVESVQRGLSSRGYVPGPLVIDPASGVRSEHSIAVLQQWMRDEA